MRYLYAVLDAQAPTPDVPGLQGCSVEPVRYADLQVLSSEIAEEAVTRAVAASLWAHERVVEAAVAATDAVLPMRFGSAVRDVPRAVAVLAGRHGDLVRGMERVRGAVEIGLRAVREGADRPDDPDAAPVDGRSWLAARAALRRRARGLAAAVHEPLAALARASCQASRVSAPTVLAASYLVETDRLDDFRAAAARLSEDLPRMALVCTGPWPPYNFTPVPGLADRGADRLGALAS